jgi:hypothetical protein
MAKTTMLGRVARWPIGSYTWIHSFISSGKPVISIVSLAKDSGGGFSMGRTLKRVPLEFEWPLHQIWRGYVNPYRAHDCKACEGQGFNPETFKIYQDCYGRERPGSRWINRITQDEVEALLAAGRLRDFTHHSTPDGYAAIVPRPTITAQQVNDAYERSGCFVHDAINHSILVETRARRLGVFGNCRTCNGTGEIWCDEKFATLRDDWERIEPPTGSAYQLWETTSEGSPVSPPFETLNDLCRWCQDNATTFGSFKVSADEWYRMLDADRVIHQEGNMAFF